MLQVIPQITALIDLIITLPILPQIHRQKNNTSENNNTTPQNNNQNKEIIDANKIDIKYDTHTQKEEMPKPATVEDTISASGSQSNVITIFTERLQVAASEAGLPINYVQTRLREIMEKKEKIKLQKNLRRLKHN